MEHEEETQSVTYSASARIIEEVINPTHMRRLSDPAIDTLHKALAGGQVEVEDAYQV